jgi:hypothetical protein
MLVCAKANCVSGQAERSASANGGTISATAHRLTLPAIQPLTKHKFQVLGEIAGVIHISG